MLQLLVHACNDRGQFTIGHVGIVRVGGTVAGVVSRGLDGAYCGSMAVRAEIIIVCQGELGHVAFGGIDINVRIMVIFRAHNSTASGTITFCFPRTRVLL